MKKLIRKVKAFFRSFIASDDEKYCDHNWIQGFGPNFGHRTCEYCGKHQMLYEEKTPNTYWE